MGYVNTLESKAPLLLNSVQDTKETLHGDLVSGFVFKNAANSSIQSEHNRQERFLHVSLINANHTCQSFPILVSMETVMYANPH